MISRAENVMGTVVSFLVDPGDLAPDALDAAIQEACDELHRVDSQFSAWIPTSELSLLRGGDSGEPSALMDEVIGLCAQAFDLSKGFFDPWATSDGFDPTGLVKGWAAERALGFLRESGVRSALVNAGGDVCVLPGSTFQVGIRHPNDPSALCGVVAVSSSIATSGVYERGHHIINPFGRDVAGISATVVGGRLAIADALATALAAGGKEVLFLLEQMVGIEGFYITPNGAMFQTSGMQFSNSQSDVI